VTFGSGGEVLTHFGGHGSIDSVAALAIQSDGKIVAAGEATVNNKRGDFALARYNPDGTIDRTFGKVVTDFGGRDELSGMAIQSDGKIVVAGTSASLSGPQPGVETIDFALARFNPDGNLDKTFGTDGKVLTDFAHPEGFDGGTDVAIQSDGRIVAAGFSGPTYSTVVSSDFALARYLP
jgi:uncharacterized delta-60 repeat protein